MKRGFSLIELSIVLVILGLLTGGILAGKSLIRASELRGVIHHLNKYQIAAKSFRDKYFGLPGDINNGTLIWGRDDSNCATDTGSGSTTGTCNGDNDRMIESALVNGGTSEEFQFWRQLTLAGLMEGTYTGISGASGKSQTLIGTNVPKATIANGGFSLQWLGVIPANGSYYPGNYGTMLQAGAQNGINRTGFPLFAPEELWNIDQKMDDGAPQAGKIRGDKPVTTVAPNCTTSNDPAITQYNLTLSTPECRLLFADYI
jgi:prepilin-type N-terminal cleavage/methylation domain-containing protein